LEDAPVALGTTLEIVDLIFQDLIVVSTPFGGKVVALDGNFRQVLPVIRKKSPVRPLFQTFNLKRNMRTFTDLDFSRWLLDIGD
jgi:hypothetical protein